MSRTRVRKKKMGKRTKKKNKIKENLSVEFAGRSIERDDSTRARAESG
jgi:hypothetical protein